MLYELQIEQKEKPTETNIFGTDRSGRLIETGEQHPSLEITYKYIKTKEI